MIDYEIGRTTATGVVLAPIQSDETMLDITLKANDISLLTLTLPCCDYGFDDFLLGYRLYVCASCDCGASFLFGKTPFIVTRREYCDDASGCNVKITAESANMVLRRKIPYDQAVAKGMAINEASDNLIKRMFRENGGVAAQTGHYNLAVDPLRNLSTVIATQANATLAPLATYTYGGQDLISAMRSVADISAGKGTPLYFGIYQDTCDVNALEFRTSINHFGTARNITVSPDNETIGDYCISEDNRNSANRVYVTDGNNAYFVVDDPTLAAQIAADPFALREAVASTSGNDPNSGTDFGRAELTRLSKILSLDGVLREGDNFRFGCDYQWGDSINAFAEGYTFSVVVDTLHFQQNGNVQIIEPSLSSQSALNGGTGTKALLARIRNLERSLARVTARV